MKKLLTTLALLLGVIAAVSAQTSFQVVPPRNVIAGNVFYVTYRLCLLYTSDAADER